MGSCEFSLATQLRVQDFPGIDVDAGTRGDQLRRRINQPIDTSPHAVSSALLGSGTAIGASMGRTS